MENYFGIIIIITFITIVITRNLILKKQGIKVIEFGGKDKKDFILIPFAVFYFYLILANTFHLPTIASQILFHSHTVSKFEVLCCFFALLIFIWAMISFKKSFRIGLVDNTSQGLIKNGAFSLSRNPIYVSFAIMLIGQFLIFHSWILLIYVILGIMTFHRQIVKEESFLEKHFGKEFLQYRQKVRRYL